MTSPIIFVAVLGLLVTSVNLEKVCSSQECARLAKEYLLNMDTSVDPCDNFYKFACGKYVANNPIIPAYQQEVAEYTKIADLIDERILKILEEPIQKTDAVYSLCLKKKYKKCMAKEDKQFSFEEFGGWPVVKDLNPDIGWQSVLYIIGDTNSFFGKNPLMTLFGDSNLKNSTERILNIKSPRYLFDEALNKSNETIKANYSDAMVRMAMKFGAEEKVAKHDMALVLEFQNHLAKNSKSTEKIYADKNASYNLYTMKQLEIEFSGISWSGFIEKFAPKFLNISNNSVINLFEPDYIKSLTKILKDTPTRVIRNYLIWKVVEASEQYLIKRKRGECLKTVSFRHRPFLSALYMKKYIKPETIAKAIDLVPYFKDQLEQTFNETKCPQNDKAKAIEKLNGLYAHVRFPDELLTDEELHSRHEHRLGDGTINLFSEADRLNFRWDTHYSKLYNSIEKTDWTDFSYLIRISPAGGEMLTNYIPMAYLQGNFFNANFPGYINFAAIGHIIARVMSNGYDNPVPEAEQNFNETTNCTFSISTYERAKCILNHFKDVPISGSKNEALSMMEDFRGLKTSYLSYQNWQSRNNEQPGLPGLNYTNNQLFWLAFSNSLCHNQKQGIYDEHNEPSEFRVNGPARNLEMFSKDFNCPIGSNMNPIKKCTPW